MSAITDAQKKVQEFATENASTLLTAGGVVGVVATGLLAGRAGLKAGVILEEATAEKKLEFARQEQAAVVEVPKDILSRTEKLMLAGPHFIPPVVTGGLTIAAIIMSHRMSGQKAAALAAAYGVSRKQLEEYKEKVAEKLTGPKREQTDAELAQERANRAPGADAVVIVAGEGDVLCFDEPTGRFFKSSMEKIRQAVNSVNQRILAGKEYADLNSFYEELGLPDCTWGDEVGFNVHNLIELTYKAIISPVDDQTPVIAIDFKRLPTEDYIDRASE
jgi:hypothetical protein